VVAGQKGAIKQHLSYYQWVPIVLLIQAFLFYIPSIIWQVRAFCGILQHYIWSF